MAGAQSGQDRVFQITLLPTANTFKPQLPTSNAYFENEGLPSKWIVFPCEWVIISLCQWVGCHCGRFYLSMLVVVYPCGCVYNSLPLSMIRYPFCPCERLVPVIGTSIHVAEFAIIASRVSVDCLPL